MSSKLEVIQPNQSGAQTSVGKSLAADRRTQAETVVPKGQGDRGDQEKS
jgi:hypothetical protein